MKLTTPCKLLSCAGASIFLVSLTVYSLGVGKALQEPVGAEEPWYLYAGQALNARGTYDAPTGCTQASAASASPHTGLSANYHPPGHTFLIAAMGRVFGDYALGARVLAVFCVLITTTLLLFQARLVFAKNLYRPFWTWLVGSVFLANPVAIKSSAAIFQDPSTYLLSLTAFQLALFCFLKRKKSIFLPPIFACTILCLYFKLTVSLLIPLCLVVFLWIHRRKLSRGQLIALFTVCTLSFFIFGLLIRLSHFPCERLLLFAYGYAGVRLSPYTTNYSGLQALMRATFNLFLTGLWMGPTLIFLFLLAFILKVHDYRKGAGDMLTDFAWIISFCFLFGHVFVGGVYNQFPRYMAPSLPGLCLIGVWFAARVSTNALQRFNLARLALWSIVLLAGSTLWYWMVVGDILYAATFRAHAFLLGGMDNNVARLVFREILRMAGYILPFLVLGYFAVLRKKEVAAMLVIPALVGSLLGMDIVQVRAPYGTYYSYGESGTWKVIEFARNLPPDRAVMAFFPIVYYKSDNVSTYHWERDWYHKDKFLDVVRKPSTQAIIYGVMDLPTQVVLNVIESPEIKTKLLSEGFKKKRIGSYSVWMKDHTRL